MKSPAKQRSLVGTYIVWGLHLAVYFLAHDTTCLDSATRLHVPFRQNEIDFRM